jgi:hypothetical protein
MGFYRLQVRMDDGNKNIPLFMTLNNLQFYILTNYTPKCVVQKKIRNNYLTCLINRLTIKFTFVLHFSKKIFTNKFIYQFKGNCQNEY